MTSPYSHIRNDSASPAIKTSQAYSSSRPFQSQRYARTGSLNDTAYNGSEGHIDDSVTPVEQNQSEPENTQLTIPSKALTQGRPALGVRFLSSLSNAQPAAAALSRKGSVLHSRAKSLAQFVPKLNPSNTSTPEKTDTPNRSFADLFHGESAPIRLGAPISPTKEKEESELVMEYKTSFTERPAGMPRRGTAHSQTSLPLVNKNTSWFGRRLTNPTPSKQQTQDELASLNINASLFPNGPADPLDPAAFNDLLLNATNLLRRMQTAYKEKVEYIASMKPEMDAQREEVEEVETRSKHLKMQLEDISRQAQQQETAVQEMAQQLADEKMKVQEAREAAQTVRLVPRSMSREDNEYTTPRRRKRTSADNASDSGFESDMESIFSEHSGADTPLSPPSTSASHSHEQPWNFQQLNGTKSIQRRPSASTVSSRPGSSNPSRQRLGGEGAAWATVDALRSENQGLRSEMDEMQKTLQGCIDLVSGVGGV